mgnify:CR=1 FL=1
MQGRISKGTLAFVAKAVLFGKTRRMVKPDPYQTVPVAGFCWVVAGLAVQESRGYTAKMALNIKNDSRVRIVHIDRPNELNTIYNVFGAPANREAVGAFMEKRDSDFSAISGL